MSLLKRLEKEKEKEKIKARNDKPTTDGNRSMNNASPIIDPWRNLKGIIHQETIKTIKTDKMEPEEVANDYLVKKGLLGE